MKGWTIRTGSKEWRGIAYYNTVIVFVWCEVYCTVSRINEFSHKIFCGKNPRTFWLLVFSVSLGSRAFFIMRWYSSYLLSFFFFFFSLYRTMTKVPSPQSDKVPCNSSSNWHRGEVYLTFLRQVTCISEAPEAVENWDIASLKRLPFLIELLLVLAYWTGLAGSGKRIFFSELLRSRPGWTASSITGTGAATYADTKLGSASRSELVLLDLTNIFAIRKIHSKAKGKLTDKCGILSLRLRLNFKQAIVLFHRHRDKERLVPPFEL